MYIEREIEKTISKTEKSIEAIWVTGPRQAGKSTVLRHMFANRKYIIINDPVLLNETKNEPGLFSK